MRRFIRTFGILFRRALFLLLVCTLLTRDLTLANDLGTQVSVRVGTLQFDFIGWTLNALGLKVAAEDVGGTTGRLVRLYIATGRVTVYKMGSPEREF